MHRPPPHTHAQAVAARTRHGAELEARVVELSAQMVSGAREAASQAEAAEAARADLHAQLAASVSARSHRRRHHHRFQHQHAPFV